MGVTFVHIAGGIFLKKGEGRVKDEEDTGLARKT
jgi:hypothetical protein